MTRIADKHIEIHLNYDRAGARSWAVMTRDLLLGLRHVETFFTKHEAIAAAEAIAPTALEHPTRAVERQANQAR